MLDFDLEIRKMKPINIRNIELNSYKMDEKIKKSIILYNTAIGEMKKNNINLAIDDLKKALFYNKSFVEAIKFMGLCYVNIGEYKKAKKLFGKLAKHEICKDIATEYLESLVFQKDMLKISGNIKEVEEIYNNTRKRPLIAKTSTWIVITLLISAISIATFSINYFNPLNIAGIFERLKYSDKLSVSEEAIDKNSNEDNNPSNSGENALMLEEVKDVQKDSNNANVGLDSKPNNYNISNLLNDADTFFNNGDYEKSANILLSMKDMNLDSEAKSRFDKLWQGIKVGGVWNIYNEGNKLYKKGKYEEALPKIKLASEIDPNLNIMPWAIFQVGMCYNALKDNNNALVYFNKVIDNYPKSSYVSNAKMMINQIGY